MRPRTREINIFNMSLIDILCGALGAFCFMVLVMLPSYRPPASAVDLQRHEADTDNLLKELEKLRQTAKDSELARQMEEMLKKLQAKIKELEGLLNRYASENEQLKSDNQQLQADKEELTAKNLQQAFELEGRNPFVTLVMAYPAQELDLYVQSDLVAPDGKTTNPPFDVAKPHHERFFLGDAANWSADHGLSLWLSREGPVGTHYKFYVKLAPQRAGRVTGSVSGNGWIVNLPFVILTPDRFWTLVGTLTIDNDKKGTFVPASDAERNEEWKKLSKATPPPSATPSTTQKPKSAEELKKEKERNDQEREKYRRIREERQRQQQQQSGSPSVQPSPNAANLPGLTDEQRRAMRERYSKEHGIQTPAASPAPSP